MNLKYFNVLIQLSQISSGVSKQLSTIQIQRDGAQALVRKILELDQRLNVLKKDLETFIILGNPVNPDRLPLDLNLQQTVSLQCTYHSIVIDVHSTLTYPWSRNLLGLPPDRFVQSQVEKSFEVVADTCHNSMLTLQYVHIDAATPLP